MLSTLQPARLHAAASAALGDADRRRQLAGGAIATLAHLAVLGFLVTQPPHRPAYHDAGPGAAVSVRLYTVAGENAVTDAPLNEPPLAGASSPQASDDGEGASEGADGDADPPDAPEAPLDPTQAVVEEANDVEQTEEAPEDAPEADEATASVQVLTAPQGEDTIPSGLTVTTNRAPAAPAALSRPAPPPTPPGSPATPVATTQDLPEAPVEAVGPPSFADIAARAAQRDDANRFLTANLLGGVAEAVRQSFCMSASDANRDAFECVEVPEDLAQRLAAFGLSGFAEQGPSFLVDLDRLEFQMRQLGADPPLIESFLTYMREARREAINRPALTRQMQRDAQGATDHLGVSSPVRPARARDPSDGG